MVQTGAAFVFIQAFASGTVASLATTEPMLAEVLVAVKLDEGGAVRYQIGRGSQSDRLGNIRYRLLISLRRSSAGAFRAARSRRRVTMGPARAPR